MNGTHADSTGSPAPSCPAEADAVDPSGQTKSRTILLASLRLVQAHCERHIQTVPELEHISRFIEDKMGDEIFTVIEADAIIPSVFYIVSIPMTDRDFEIYNSILITFRLPGAVHRMLSVGSQEFDQFSDSQGIELQQIEARRWLRTLVERGADLEGILDRLVKHCRSMWQRDYGAGYIGDQQH